jgi:hypothetical protein
VSKKRVYRRHTSTTTTSQPLPLPYLFNLPDELDLVKIYAYAQASENAHIVIRDKVDLQQIGIQAMTVNACLMTEKLVIEGKQGTNDPVLFRKTYIDMFAEQYPIAREMLLTGQARIDPAWTEIERLSILFTIAERNIASHK